MAAPPPPVPEGKGTRRRAFDPVDPVPEPGPATFFARQTYRRRRLMDAARMVPIFGIALFLLPTVWVTVDRPASTGAGFVYLFAVWVLLILLGRIIARRIMEPLPEAPEDLPVAVATASFGFGTAVAPSDASPVRANAMPASEDGRA